LILPNFRPFAFFSALLWKEAQQLFALLNVTRGAAHSPSRRNNNNNNNNNSNNNNNETAKLLRIVIDCLVVIC
jgi:hypothetical protein